jgi:hypothetical protein
MKKKVAFLICVSKNDNLIYFKEAIYSIYNQTYGKDNINIYLCIDGYIDNGLEKFIIEEQKNFYFLIKNKEQKGLAYSLNKLIDFLKEEEYVFRMDSDDICKLDRVEKQVDYLEKNKEIEILGSAIEIIDEKGNFLGKRVYPIDNEEAKKTICLSSPFAHPAVCFRKSFFDKGFRYNSIYKFAQDIDLWFRALENNILISNLKESLLEYRVSNLNLKNRGIKRLYYEFQIFFKGIYRVHGINFCMVLSLIKLLSRLFPNKLKCFLYKFFFKRF